MAIKKPLKKGTTITVDKLNKETGKKDIILEKGNPAEITDRTLPHSVLPLGKSIVGLSRGYTISLGNYQSARVDCWMMDLCDSNDKSKMDKMAEMSSLIDEQIEYECSEVQNFIENLK